VFSTWSVSRCYKDKFVRVSPHPKYAHKKIKNICRNKYVNFFSQIKQQHRQELMFGFAYLNAGLLARSHFASGGSCDRPTRSRFCVVFLDPRANAELIPKFHIALFASHAALPMSDQISL
jgi:hypothetical protein